MRKYKRLRRHKTRARRFIESAAAFRSSSSCHPRLWNSRLEDLHVSIAACLAAHAMNIDLTEVAKRGVPALDRGRLSHVNQNYLGAETYTAANPHLVEHQAAIPYARALGGGMVAGIDGMRFVVPIPSIYARPNRKYFGPDRGA